MSREPYTLTNIANRIRVSSPGIIAAVVLTIAAAGFLTAALIGSGGRPNPDVPAVAHKPPQHHSAVPVSIETSRQ